METMESIGKKKTTSSLQFIKQYARSYMEKDDGIKMIKNIVKTLNISDNAKIQKINSFVTKYTKESSIRLLYIFSFIIKDKDIQRDADNLDAIICYLHKTYDKYEKNYFDKIKDILSGLISKSKIEAIYKNKELLLSFEERLGIIKSYFNNFKESDESKEEIINKYNILCGEPKQAMYYNDFIISFLAIIYVDLITFGSKGTSMNRTKVEYIINSLNRQYKQFLYEQLDMVLESIDTYNPKDGLSATGRATVFLNNEKNQTKSGNITQLLSQYTFQNGYDNTIIERQVIEDFLPIVFGYDPKGTYAGSFFNKFKNVLYRIKTPPTMKEVLFFFWNVYGQSAILKYKHGTDDIKRLAKVCAIFTDMHKKLQQQNNMNKNNMNSMNTNNNMNNNFINNNMNYIINMSNNNYMNNNMNYMNNMSSIQINIYIKQI